MQASDPLSPNFLRSMFASSPLPSLVRSLSTLLLAVLLCGGLSVPAGAQPAGGVQTFAVDVPSPASVSGRSAPIRTLKLTVTLAPTVSGATFTVIDPEGTETILDDGDGPYSISGSQDLIISSSPSPGDRQHVLTLRLDSDVDNENGNCETSTMSGDEQWVIQADGRKIESALAKSMPSEAAPGGNCQDGPPLDPSVPAEGAATIAEPEVDACAEGGSGPRPPVHAVLLLDGSGSMGNTVTGAAGAERKVDALKAAVQDFVDVWEQERQASTCAAIPSDQIGVATFRTQAQWWSPLGSGLQGFAGAASTIANNIDGLSATGTTALGQGLQLANDAFSGTAGSARRVVLYLSNGIQNVRPYALEQGGSIVLEAQDGTTTPLDNLGDGQAHVYAVTVGTDAVTNPEVNQNIARGGGGDYLNSETSATVLRPFFLEVLQETLAFATTQTALLESGAVETGSTFRTQVGINTTTEWVSFNVAWAPRQAVLRLRATSPQGRTFEATGQRTIRLPVSLPTDSARGSSRPWDVEIEVVDPIGRIEEVPFELNVMTDDPAVKANFSVGADRYATGDTVTLRARVSEYGLPLDTLRTKGSVQARLAEPGTPIGELLAREDASTEAPAQGDRLSANEAELYNLLRERPDLLTSSVRTVDLRDDGTQGDSVAGDGTFTGQFVADTAGHTNILFEVEGPSRNAGLVQRQRRTSVYVRAMPDPATTEVQADTVSGADGPLLRVTVTPRTATGALVGPGWEHYFRFQTQDGRIITPTGAGDGSYTAEISYSDGLPAVDLHYLDAPRLIDESTEATPSLDNSTRLVPSVESEVTEGGISWWWGLLVLVLLLILGFLASSLRE